MKSMSEVPYHFGLKMRAYPTPKQQKIMNLNLNAARRIYNLEVAMDKELFQLKNTEVFIAGYDERIDELKKRKSRQAYLANAHPFLYNKKLDSTMVSQAKRNYSTAWKNYRQNKSKFGIPQFKKWQPAASYQISAIYSKRYGEPSMYNSQCRFVDENTIRLPKLGNVSVCGSQARILRNKKDIRIGTITISRSNRGKYYISMQLGSETPFVDPLPKTGKEIGIDLNSNNFLTQSDGIEIDNPELLERDLTRLANANRVLARRRSRALAEGRNLQTAANYQKQLDKVRKIYEKITNRRINFVDAVSSYLVKNYDFIAAEDLSSNEMLGKSHDLNRKIYDASWHTFLNKMSYKAELYGKTFIMVDPANTTQMCSKCGHIMGTDGTKKLNFNTKTNPKKKWICPKCGAEHQSDWNAAINILARGKEDYAKQQKAAAEQAAKDAQAAKDKDAA